MIRLKSNLNPFLFFFIFIYSCCLSQKFNYDLNNDRNTDKVTLDTKNQLVKINLDKTESTFEIPEITGYENIKLIQFKKNYINIHYYSSGVSSIDLFIFYKNKKWILFSTLFFNPCQNCQSELIETYENQTELVIEDVNEESIESIIFNKKGYRKFYQKKIPKLNEISHYAEKIIQTDYCIKQNTINNLLNNEPISKFNLSKYKRLYLTLKRINLYPEIVQKAIFNFEKKSNHN